MRMHPRICSRNRYKPLAAAVLAALCGATLSAQAATVSVNNAGDPATGNAANCSAGNANTCTLRDAVAAALAGDTIDFSSDLAITLGGMLTLGKNVAIDGSGHAVGITGSKTAFLINVGVTARMTWLTVHDVPYVSTNYAGGIDNRGTLTLSHSTISGNHGRCGGIHNSVSLTLINSTVSSNKGYSLGGGICTSGSTTLIDSTVAGNFGSNSGGGIYNSGVLKLIRTTVTTNMAPPWGGGIFNSNTATLIDSTVNSNAAGRGGGIYNATSATLTLTNSTLAGNLSSTAGAAISNDGTVTLTGSTLSKNQSNNTGGIYAFSGSVTTAIDSIIAGNLLMNKQPGTDLNGTLASGSSGNFVGGNPMLGALADNGGPTQTMLLQTGSPAIDAISCANAPPTDQRGMIRPDPGNPSATPCDIGAVEVGSISDEIFKDGFGGD